MLPLNFIILFWRVLVGFLSLGSNVYVLDSKNIKQLLIK
jgi:hypothetical protein